MFFLITCARLEFDHDAAFRASWAIDELIARVDGAAVHRAAVADHLLGSCEGPFAEHLRRQVSGAGHDAGMVVSALRRLQRRVEDARDAALLEDVRRQVAAAEWKADQAFAREIEARAARALSGAGSATVVPASPI